jgi:hypothetical protein
MKKCGWCGCFIEDWDCPKWRRFRGQCFCSFDCIAAGAYEGNSVVLIGSIFVLGSLDILLGIQLLQDLTLGNFVMWLFPTVFVIIFLSYLTHVVLTGRRIRKLRDSAAEV